MNRCAAIVLLAATALCACSTPRATTPEAPRPAAVAELQPTVPLGAALVRSVRPWDDGGCPGVCVCTERYCLRLALKDTTFRDRLPAYMEACSEAYAKAIVPLPVPAEPMDLYVFASRGPWEAWTRRTLGDEAGLYLGLGRGGFTTDGVSVLYDLGRVDTLTILAHEGWHQFSQRSLKDALPTWLEEGLACFMEGTRMNRDGEPTPFRPWRNMERWSEARNAVRGESLLPLQELLETTPQACLERGKDELLSYYAQCWALVHFLNEGEGGRYREALRRLLADAADGSMVARLERSPLLAGADAEARRRAARSRTGALAMREYVRPDLSRMDAEFRAFVSQITRRGAGDRIFRGESPLSEPAATKASPATPPAK
jgi:hypothetical protein